MTKRVTILQWLYDSVLVKEDKLLAEPVVVKPKPKKTPKKRGRKKKSVVAEV